MKELILMAVFSMGSEKTLYINLGIMVILTLTIILLGFDSNNKHR